MLASFKGRHHSDATKKKMSDMRKGKGSSTWKGGVWLYGPNGKRHEARLMLQPPEDMEIHHLDGNPLNNDVSNLKIVTRREHQELDGRIERMRQWNFAKHAKERRVLRELILSCKFPDTSRGLARQLNRSYTVSFRNALFRLEKEDVIHQTIHSKGMSKQTRFWSLTLKNTFSI